VHYIKPVPGHEELWSEKRAQVNNDQKCREKEGGKKQEVDGRER